MVTLYNYLIDPFQHCNDLPYFEYLIKVEVIEIDIIELYQHWVVTGQLKLLKQAINRNQKSILAPIRLH